MRKPSLIRTWAKVNMPSDGPSSGNAWRKPSAKANSSPHRKKKAMNPSQMEQKTATAGWRRIFIIISEPFPAGWIEPRIQGRNELP